VKVDILLLQEDINSIMFDPNFYVFNGVVRRGEIIGDGVGSRCDGDSGVNLGNVESRCKAWISVGAASPPSGI
jgi:hypothetical protein